MQVAVTVIRERTTSAKILLEADTLKSAMQTVKFWEFGKLDDTVRSQGGWSVDDDYLSSVHAETL